MTLDELIRSRRSRRAFEKTKPHREDIRRMAEAGAEAPNACNLQSYALVYVDDNEILTALVAAATRKINWAPACFVAFEDRSVLKKRRAGLQSLAACLQNMVLKAEELGYGTCWIAGFRNDRRINRILKMNRCFTPAAIVLIGTPRRDDLVARPFRKPMDQFLHFNRMTHFSPYPATLDVDSWSMDQVIAYRRHIAPVYAPRFKLAPFSPDTVTESTAVLSRLIPDLTQHPRTILDVSTYDGLFARELKARLSPDSHLIVSDHFNYPLQNFTEAAPRTRTVLISPDNTFSGLTRQVDLAAWVNKIEYTPNPASMMSGIRQTLSETGVLFLVSASPHSGSALKARLAALLPGTNYFENNPKYRIGPFRFRSPKWITRCLEKTGYRIITSGQSTGQSLIPFSGLRLNWWLAEPAGKT